LQIVIEARACAGLSWGGWGARARGAKRQSFWRKTMQRRLLEPRAATRDTGVIPRIASHVRVLWQRYWEWRATQAMVFLLSTLDDRMLKDIGVDRSDIEAIAQALGYTKREFALKTRGRSGLSRCD
jgi:uncharacterized protein YjiS (DUF1127 family)